jgi:hypothetical protein
VLEPGFYHRIEVDLGIDVPNPHVVSIDVRSLATHELKYVDIVSDSGNALDGDAKWRNMAALVDKLLSPENNCKARLVLDLFDSEDKHSVLHRGKPVDMNAWAKDSVSSWGDGVIDKRGYVFMPRLADRGRLVKRKQVHSQCGSTASGINTNNNAMNPKDIAKNVGICPEFLRREMSNRACFNKCT